MPRKLFSFIKNIVLLLFAAATLTGCATVRLVPTYDEQIDSGLTQLYGDTVVFVDGMIVKKGTPQGEYQTNVGFYDQADARLEALIVRAEAHRVLNDCPAGKIVDRALSLARLPVEVRSQIGNLPKDDCQVVLLRLVKGGFGDMRRFHQAQGALGIPASARGPILDGGVGALLRAAITVEIAKRAR